MKAINLEEKFSLFTERWSPRVVAEMNDYQFKLVKIEGEFVWHEHPDTDESFIVIEGRDLHAARQGFVGRLRLRARPTERRRLGVGLRGLRWGVIGGGACQGAARPAAAAEKLTSRKFHCLSRGALGS